MLLNDPTECFTVLGQIKFRQVLALKNRAINEALLELADNISISFSNIKSYSVKKKFQDNDIKALSFICWIHFKSG